MAEVTRQLICDSSSSPPKITEEAKELYKPDATKPLPKRQYSHSPTFIYACDQASNKLHKANLLTGEQTCHKVFQYNFKLYCSWTELPGGSLLITGGKTYTSAREVTKIGALREFAVSSLPPMHTARHNHAAVYHSQHLYALAGYNRSELSECERFVFEESRWEKLPALPVACQGLIAVVLENSLYALGGNDDQRYLDTVQKLRLDSLTWELMQLKLPQPAYFFLCFKTDTQVYLVIKKNLYSFTPDEVKPIKTLRQRIWCNSSYYSRGTLYYTVNCGIKSLAVGELA
jgi:hypothetical protein